MKENHFDYIIIGAGMSGLQLALKLSEDIFFQDKKIAVIDSEWEQKNDKTWCFWEKDTTHWDNIAYKSWRKGEFLSKKRRLCFDLSPYYYKMIRSEDFYSYIVPILNARHNLTLIKETFIKWKENQKEVIVTTDKSVYISDFLFDSSSSQDFKTDTQYIKVWQHFKGIEIETNEPCFNPDVFRMMDYRLSYPKSTSFMYVLPFNPQKALVEFTFFSPFFVDEKVYDEYLENYIRKYIKSEKYQIIRMEKGVIPMTTFPFNRYNTNRCLKIGTAGGWVKPSSGYAFKNTEKRILQVLKNIKEGKTLSEGLFSKKYQFYDDIFLRVLCENNELGVWIFEQFYFKNKIQDMFLYLDEEINLEKDIRIMSSLFSRDFLNAFMKYIMKGKRK
ncbi:lycopene cyclase [Weeksellaceae bacterium TAE3-ERU29]|nr:lycopene cyclase [Weeksellaceae bacterium TAE3-ERU29]